MKIKIQNKKKKKKKTSRIFSTLDRARSFSNED